MAAPPLLRADFGDLERVLRAAAAGRRVVGFDVFDTLLRRRVEPETVKDRTACELARRTGGDPRVLRDRRRAIERALYEERRRAGQEGEFLHLEVLRRWVAETAAAGAPAERLVEDLAAHERELEGRAQAPTPGIAQVLAALAATGRRLVFVSDMYFRSAEIRAFLDRFDLGRHFAAGYVSCEHGARKASGRLFERVLAAEGIGPEAFLFVGNNRAIDVDPARRLGIAAVHLDDAAEHKRHLALEVAGWAAARGPLWAGHLAREVVETIPHRVRAGASAAYDLGLVMALPYVTFVLHVMEALDARPARQVYFLSREGWLFFRLYRRLAAALGRPAPRGRYLFASRIATFLPSMRRLDWEELQRMWKQYDRQSLHLLLRNLTLPEEEFDPLARACGIADLDAPLGDPADDAGFRSFLAHPEVQRRFTAQRDAARALLADYLRQIGVFGGGEVLFVDVGWKGSIQANICRAFEDDPAFPFVRGLYFGYLGTEAPSAGHTMSGFLADGRDDDALANVVFGGVTPFELTATAPHGTCVGYARPPGRRGRVVPRLVSHDVERRSAALVREAMGAIDDWLGDFLDCRGLFALDVDVLAAAAADQLRRYVRYPSRREVELFATYDHVESFGVHGISTLRRPAWYRRLRPRSPRRALREFWQELERDVWAGLTLRRARVPFGQFARDLLVTLRDVR